MGVTYGYIENVPCCVMRNCSNSLLTDVLTDGAYAEITHLYATSAALSAPVQSYMPPTSNISSGTNPYTCVISRRGMRSSQTPVCTLMWTSCTVPPAGETLKVNHIIWLADRQHSEMVQLDDGSDDESNTTSDSDTCDGVPVPCDEPEPMADVDEGVDAVVDLSCDEDDVTTTLPGIPLPGNDGLSTSDVIKLLTADADQLPHPVLPTIPHGVKSNVYFVVENGLMCYAVRHANRQHLTMTVACGSHNELDQPNSCTCGLKILHFAVFSGLLANRNIAVK